MICDIHVHVAGDTANHSGNYLAPRFTRSIAFRYFVRQFELGRRTNQSWRLEDLLTQTLAWIENSDLDKAVLLALDAAYRQDGTRDVRNTRVVVDNDFVADLADRQKKTLFGASVHPYRADALQELARVIERGACLIKWLPGAQNITADDSRCMPFYEVMAHHRIPLLCHTGNEHALKAFPNRLNDPRKLVPALKAGVTVIAAHCGTSMYLHESSYFQEWRKLAEEHEHFYGDLSAFGIITRLRPLRTILSNPVLRSKVVFGSDFPVPALPLACVTEFGFQKALELRRIGNPFQQAVALLKAAGVPDEVFSRGSELIRVAGAVGTPQARATAAFAL